MNTATSSRLDVICFPVARLQNGIKHHGSLLVVEGVRLQLIKSCCCADHFPIQVVADCELKYSADLRPDQ
eukprot:8960803-Lingulodinium_polyedra.AAC.1